MNELNIAIGKNIRKLRESKGYTREKLAEMADMNDKYLYEIESGRKGMSAQKIYNLSRSLNVTIDFIVSGENNNNNREYEMIMLLISSFEKNEVKLIEGIIRNIIEIKKANLKK